MMLEQGCLKGFILGGASVGTASEPGVDAWGESSDVISADKFP